MRKLWLLALLTLIGCNERTEQQAPQEEPPMEVARVDTVRIVDTVRVVERLGYPSESNERIGAFVVEHPERGTLACRPVR